MFMFAEDMKQSKDILDDIGVISATQFNLVPAHHHLPMALQAVMDLILLALVAE